MNGCGPRAEACNARCNPSNCVLLMPAVHACMHACRGRRGSEEAASLTACPMMA